MPAYLTDRINTIFLDGKPVDNVNTAIVNDGSTLALSAAMPGLVGATFRKAGCLASFRGSITYREESADEGVLNNGHMTLKLFNLLLREMGPQVLERGLWMNGDDLIRLLEFLGRELGSLPDRIKIEAVNLPGAQISNWEWITPETTYSMKVLFN
jgi:hypothetical protein